MTVIDDRRVQRAIHQSIAKILSFISFQRLSLPKKCKIEASEMMTLVLRHKRQASYSVRRINCEFIPCLAFSYEQFFLKQFSAVMGFGCAHEWQLFVFRQRDIIAAFAEPIYLIHHFVNVRSRWDRGTMSRAFIKLLPLCRSIKRHSFWFSAKIQISKHWITILHVLGVRNPKTLIRINEPMFRMEHREHDLRFVNGI